MQLIDGDYRSLISVKLGLLPFQEIVVDGAILVLWH